MFMFSAGHKTMHMQLSNLLLSLSVNSLDSIALLDIPVYSSRIHSLHNLFSLYMEFKNSQVAVLQLYYADKWGLCKLK